MKPQTIIVTGGAGFLGRHLCRALAMAGHIVLVIDLKTNPEYSTIIADVRDFKRMAQLIQGADVVFHLASLIEAGESVKNPAKFIDYNLMGTLSVLEAMKQNHVPHFIFSSSAAIYGNPLRTPILEDDRTLPINPYGMTKQAMEGLLSSFVASHGLTGMALRYFNLYGPEEHHEPETHAIPRFIAQINTGQEVTVWGDGRCQRDYIYITDVVDAHLKALEYCLAHPKQYHYFNLSTEVPTSVMEIITKLEGIMGKKANIKHFEPRPGDPDILVASAQKAREILGWQSHVDLETGLSQTVNYFLKQNFK